MLIDFNRNPFEISFFPQGEIFGIYNYFASKKTINDRVLI